MSYRASSALIGIAVAIVAAALALIARHGDALTNANIKRSSLAPIQEVKQACSGNTNSKRTTAKKREVRVIEYSDLPSSLDSFFGQEEYELAAVHRRRAALDKHLADEAKDGGEAEPTGLSSAVQAYHASMLHSEAAVRINAVLFQALLRQGKQTYNKSMTKAIQSDRAEDGFRYDPTIFESVVNLFVRDWSTEGEQERNEAVHLIKGALQESLKKTRSTDENDTRPVILFPGAGLGRIAYEMAWTGGYEVHANELDFGARIAWHWLNAVADEAKETSNPSLSYALHPFVTHWSHQRSSEERVRVIRIPDRQADAASVKLLEGDFFKVFDKTEAQYDCIVTVFFIDMVPNMPRLLRMMKRMLKPHGCWINFGPLKYGPATQLVLSREEVFALAGEHGLYVDMNTLKEVKTTYGESASALFSPVYHAQFWVAHKVV